MKPFLIQSVIGAMIVLEPLKKHLKEEANPQKLQSLRTEGSGHSLKALTFSGSAVIPYSDTN